LENVRSGCCDESESLEERLARRLAKEAIWERGRVVEVGEVYGGVEEYDPVLRSHCRLGTER
jgi:hypothetical protein